MHKALFGFMFLIFIAGNACAEIRIGWIGPLTGSAAVLGVDSAPAVQLAVEEVNNAGGINGEQIKLFIEDDRYETAKTLAAYQKLVQQQKVKVLFVVTYGGVFALAERAKKDGVVIIDPLDCDAAFIPLPRNVICVAKRTEDLGKVIAEEVNRKKLSPISLLYFDGDPFMGTVAKAFKDNLDLKNIKITNEQSYNNSDTDFRTFVSRSNKEQVKAAVLLGYDQLGTAIRGFRSSNKEVEIFALATVVSPAARELSGVAIENTIISVWKAQPSAAYSDFSQKLFKKTGRPIALDVFAVPPYDATRLVIRGLQAPSVVSNKGQVNVELLLNNIYEQPALSGASGEIVIEADGTSSGFSSSELYRVKDQDLVMLGGKVIGK